jgi:ubiquinol-cytochrome c reductase cytochrome c1 subunit
MLLPIINRLHMKQSNLLLVTLLAGSVLATSAFASSDALPPRNNNWSFDGMFGTVDKPAAQRGFQVFKEVCSACHSLNRVAFRSLTDIGFSPAEVKALAATYTVKDGPNDDGEMFDRPGLPSDKFVPPYANEQAARAAQNGAFPPDLSLIIKARPNGANYIYSLLTGFGQEVPEHIQLADGQHYNPYMSGGKIAMAAPLADGGVTYSDGTVASVDQMAKDVVNFLQWTAEPEMETRKQTGIKVLIYLAIFTGFMYVAKRRLWSKLH